MGRKKKFPNPYEDPEFIKLTEEFAELKRSYFEVIEPMFQELERKERTVSKTKVGIRNQKVKPSA